MFYFRTLVDFYEIMPTTVLFSFSFYFFSYLFMVGITPFPIILLEISLQYNLK